MLKIKNTLLFGNWIFSSRINSTEYSPLTCGSFGLQGWVYTTPVCWLVYDDKMMLAVNSKTNARPIKSKKIFIAMSWGIFFSVLQCAPLKRNTRNCGFDVYTNKLK